MPRAFLIKKKHQMFGQQDYTCRQPLQETKQQTRKSPPLGFFSIDHILNSSGNSSDNDDDSVKENKVMDSNIDDLKYETNKENQYKRRKLEPVDDVRCRKSDADYPTIQQHLRNDSAQWSLNLLANPYLALNYRLQQQLQAHAMQEIKQELYSFRGALPHGYLSPPLMPLSRSPPLISPPMNCLRDSATMEQAYLRASSLSPPSMISPSSLSPPSMISPSSLSPPSMISPSCLSPPSMISPPLTTYKQDAAKLPFSIDSLTSDLVQKPRQKDNETPRYQCEACSKSYSTFSGLSKHKQFHCQEVVKKQFNCNFCDKEYSSLGALKMHIRTHTLPCKCHICGKAFSRPWLLQGHIRTHTGEKPFSCQHCNRAFADRSNLRAHLQTHSDVKKYSCKTCAKTFSRMSLLLKHEDGGCSSMQHMTHFV